MYRDHANLSNCSKIKPVCVKKQSKNTLQNSVSHSSCTKCQTSIKVHLYFICIYVMLWYVPKYYINSEKHTIIKSGTKTSHSSEFCHIHLCRLITALLYSATNIVIMLMYKETQLMQITLHPISLSISNLIMWQWFNQTKQTKPKTNVMICKKWWSDIVVCYCKFYYDLHLIEGLYPILIEIWRKSITFFD